MTYEFTPDLATNNKIIDEQHRDLLAKINEFTDACMKGKGRSEVESALKFMLDYTDMHFKTEENLQITNFYPGYDSHKAAHRALKESFGIFFKEFSTEKASVKDVATFNTLASRLISHIKIEDKKLANYLNERNS